MPNRKESKCIKDSSIIEILLIRTADGESRYVVDKENLKHAITKGEALPAIKAGEETFMNIELDGEFWAALETYALFGKDFHEFLNAVKKKQTLAGAGNPELIKTEKIIHEAFRSYPGLRNFISGAENYDGLWTSLGDLRRKDKKVAKKA